MGNIFKPIAGLYVFWQGMTLLVGLKDGESSMGFLTTVLLGLCFVGFGVWCVVSYYKDYKKYKKEQEEEAARIAAEEAKEAENADESAETPVDGKRTWRDALEDMQDEEESSEGEHDL